MTLRLSPEDERALAALAEAEGVSEQEATVRAIREAAARRGHPSASVFGRDAYPGIDAKAGALLESIVVNHPLVDGNNRLGWLAVVVLYGINGIDLQAPDDAAYDLVIAVARDKADHQVAARHLARWHELNPTAPGKSGCR